MADETDRTHFGFKSVPLAEKQERVNDVFHTVARRYDLMNDLMSAGLHRAWKDALVTSLKPPKRRPFRHLDVAGGTGDVAFRVLDAGGPMTHEANAEALPFPVRSFDGYSIAFGIRNVTRIEAALAEAHRVLRPGAQFLCLEFSRVDVPGLDALYDAYSFNVIPRLGRMVAGDADSYRYLVESIRRFPSPAAFGRMIAAAGFRRVTHRLFTGGVVALHGAWKI